MPALLAARIAHLLATRRGDAPLAARVRERVERMLATTDAVDRERASRSVPRLRRILGPG